MTSVIGERGQPYLGLEFTQYLQAPTIGTVKALKRILAYLADTVDKALRVARVGTTDWQIYSDSDHAGDRQFN